MTVKTSLMIASLFALLPLAAHAETPAGHVAKTGDAQIMPVVKHHIDMLNGGAHQHN